MSGAGGPGGSGGNDDPRAVRGGEELDVGALANELTRFPFARLLHTTLPAYALRHLEDALGQATSDLPPPASE